MSLDARYPRVLVVVGEPFNSRTSTGFTMGGLFRGWPKDRLGQVYTAPMALETEICERYFKLSPSNTGLGRVLGSLRRPGDRSAAPAATGAAAAGSGPVAVPQRWRREVNAWADLQSYVLTPEFWAWVEALRPQVVYSMLASSRQMLLALDVCRRYGLPLVPHFMDDWPETLHRGTLAGPLARPRLAGLLKRSIAASSRGMAIGDAMCEEYQRRYGIPFEAFMNCVESDLLRQESPLPPPGEVLRLAYIGGLHLERWRSLREIGEVLARLWEEGQRAELLIYAHARALEEYREQLTLPPVMRVVGSLTAQEVPAAQRAADCLVHVESFNDREARFTRYSVSGKIPEYMAAGRPILAYGPGQVASLRYLDDSGCGLVVGSQDPVELAEALRSLIGSPELRQRLALRAREVALARHDASVQRERFRQSLAEVAGTTERAADPAVSLE